jgi:hypothetical protein
MTFFGMALLTAEGTVVLAIFAIVTAWFSRRAFLKQSQEVAAIERQVVDGQEAARQQGELLKVQSGQFKVQRDQFESLRRINEKQAEVLALQAEDLRESIGSGSNYEKLTNVPKPTRSDSGRPLPGFPKSPRKTVAAILPSPRAKRFTWPSSPMGHDGQSRTCDAASAMSRTKMSSRRCTAPCSHCRAARH